MAAALAGCGGDGGDPVVGPINITLANRDAVAHAAASAIYAMSPAGEIPIGASGQDAGMTWRLPSATVLMSRVLSIAQGPAAARAAMRRPLAVSGPVTEPCTLGGTVTVTYDDRDNDLAPSVGDVMTIEFVNCRETPDVVFNGSTVATYTLVSPTPVPSVSARMTMTRLSMAEPQHSIRLDGTALVEFRDQGPSARITRITAEGPVAAAVTTHQFSDTVTMRDGFWIDSLHDPNAAPPPGGFGTGRSTITLQGAVESSAIAGVLNVSTVAGAPILDYDADPYPRSGAVRVTSGQGALVITALSPAQVRIDLDIDENGTPDSTTTQTWDWLI